MKIHHIKSSVIQAIGYDRNKKVLAVLFKSEAIYFYEKVPPQTFTAFRKAESAGKFFNERILGKYEDIRAGEKKSKKTKSLTFSKTKA